MTLTALPRVRRGIRQRRDLDYLRELERRVLWLATWTVHNANHLRPKRDGLKVGGHQASSASSVSLLTALFFHTLRPQDRIAVKPHASPVFHVIQYLLGRQSREQLELFRALGGAQSYPSRTKDADEVDFSTGSEGMGVAATLFASIVQDYLRAKGMDGPPGRMVALAGDAELDEGNIYEAMLEGWKHDVRNLWWIVDYNRQSLDGVVNDRLNTCVDGVFKATGWRVVTLKYGKRLEAAFARPGGPALRDWIDACPNSVYSALTFKGGASWREHLLADIGGDSGVRALLDAHDDPSLAALMTNLAGHDLETVLDAFDHASDSDQPTCFIAYTIKGYGLPFAGHKDNHAGLMSPEQVEELRARMGIEPGREWDRFGGLGLPEADLAAFVASTPLARQGSRVLSALPIAVPERLPEDHVAVTSTQDAFGRLLFAVGGSGGELADAIVTASPDVTVSTNLAGWVNRRGVFARDESEDAFRAENVLSTVQWKAGPGGQHIELGIAESNLFLLLAAAGLSDRLFGRRLLPVGTLYDTFIARGLDALNYACYQDARFIIAGTPSGLALAPEGGAHQSIVTPLIGLGQPGITSFEPAYADEMAAIMRWAFEHMQAPDGGSVYLRLSTRALEQPRREMSPELREQVLAGAYWLHEPAEGAELAICYAGAVAPEALAALREVEDDIPGAGLLAVTSAGRLYKEWSEARTGGSHVERLLGRLSPEASLVTVTDGHPASLSWLGGVVPQRTYSLGVRDFGQSGDIPDLFHHYGIDASAIIDACARAIVEAARRRRAASR